MRQMRLTFTNDEYNKLKKARKLTTYCSWEKFLVGKCTKGVSVKRNGNKNSLKNVHGIKPIFINKKLMKRWK